MINYDTELKNRVEFIKNLIKSSGAKGIVFGNSGGKDSALVGILCKMACDNTLGVIMPCQSKQNLGRDTDDAVLLSKQFGIENITVNLSDVKTAITTEIEKVSLINKNADININPRLRMTTLYTIAQSRDSLVAGTGNKSEIYMGYFTKWGDGAYDFNPIADLTATEVFEFLSFLNAPKSIIGKAPSAGLFDGQTDESEMGVMYAEIDEYIRHGSTNEKAKEIINMYHKNSEHKRNMPIIYGG